jgi:hypothetical protein
MLMTVDNERSYILNSVRNQVHLGLFTTVLVAYKTKVGLRDHRAVCVCVCPSKF